MSLWEMLGGEKVVKSIVNDFVELAIRNPRVNYTRGGRYVLTADSILRTKQAAVKFLGAATGGPEPYEGRSLRDIHSEMQITDPEFSAIVEDFRTALQRNGIAPSVLGITILAVERIRNQIVEQR